jgi:DHA1 family multidrug resistance protein-like MFS transporter
LRSPLVLVCAAAFLYMLGLSVIFPVVPTFVRALGLSESEAGILVSSYALASFFMAPLWGSVSQRIGRKPTLLIGLAGFALGFVCFGSSSSFAALLAARGVGGLLAAAVMPAIFAYAADTTVPERRSTVMGAIGAAVGVGVLFGVVLGGTLGSVDPRLPFFTAGAIGAATLGCTALWLPESLTPERRAAAQAERAAGESALRLTRRLLPFLSFGFLIQVARSALEGTIGFLILDRFAGGSRDTGLILGVSTLIAVGVQGGLLRALTRVASDRGLMLGGTLLLSLGLLWTGMAERWGLLIAASALLGVGAGVVEPTFRGELSRVSEAIQGEVQGLHSSAQSLARALAFALFPALYESWMPEWVFALAAASGVAALGIGVAALRSPATPALPVAAVPGTPPAR